MDKQLILIRGVQGSGKSTLANSIIFGNVHEGSIFLSQTNWVHFEADMYFINPISGEYVFDGAKIGEAHRWCEYNTNKSMEQGKNIIVSNTFVKRKELQVYLEMAEKHGYTQIQEIICKGHFKNTHGVPEEKVESKRKNFEY